MRRARGKCAGFTTAEVLVAALFALLVVATLYSFYREQLFNLLSQETRTATLEDGRGALDMMVRELRNAGAFPVTTDATCAKDGQNIPLRVVSASADSIQIQSDLNGDGTCATGEKVTYAYSSTPTSTCPGANIRRENDCLVANVTKPAGKLFTYYDTSEVLLADTPSNPSDIKRVKITFRVQVKSPNPNVGENISSTFSSSVEFRN